MNAELRYFTGTGNSLKIIKTCMEILKNKYVINISEIKNEDIIPEDTDLLGFCFPVYAFGIPRICRNYLKQLPDFNKAKNTFVIITAGANDESGFSINECTKILRKKNCNIIYTSVIEMPVNWTTFMNPPSKEEVKKIIRNGVEKAVRVSNDIMIGKSVFHKFNKPGKYSWLGFYKEYYLFRLIGIKNIWRCFKVYDSCNGCGICAKICSVKSIKMVNGTPRWSSSWEQCMRCVNFCPMEAINQTMGGGTRGRNKYYEPDFNPLKN